MDRRQFLAGAALAGLATSGAVAQDDPILAAIRAEGLDPARSQIMDLASWLTDVSGPRLTASPGEIAAARWLEGRLKSLGFSNVALEPWPEDPSGRRYGFKNGWINERFFMQATAPYPYAIPGAPVAWTPGTNGPVSGDVVVIADASEAGLRRAAENRGLRGKWVMIQRPINVTPLFTPPARRFTDEQLTAMGGVGNGRLARPDDEIGRASPQARPSLPPPTSRSIPSGPPASASVRNAILKAEGALGLLTATGRGHGVFPAQTGQNTADPAGQPTTIVLAAEQYGRLYRTAEKGVKTTIEADIRTRFIPDPPLFNIVAELPGTDLKDEVVIIGAHFDSWHAATGANDNAAGCAIMVEALRLLKASRAKLRRTVRVCLWTGEEQGVVGSGLYVREHFGGGRLYGQSRTTPAEPVKPGYAKLQAYLNLDNGAGVIRGIYSEENLEAEPQLASALAPVKDLGGGQISSRRAGSTDHIMFDQAGLPGFQFIQDPIEYSLSYHSNIDFYEQLPPDDMRRNAVIVAGVAYALANGPKLPRKPTVNREGVRS